MMMTLMMIMMMITEHECIWGTFWEGLWMGGGGKERILQGEEDPGMLHIYEDSTMKLINV
jgi:hypothetical protein